MPAIWYNGVITNLKYLSDNNTILITLHVDGFDSFDFIPGQFITLDLPVGDKRAQRWRSYSIASEPNGSADIELCIVLNEQGIGTPFIFELEIGDILKFKGPDGGFVLPSNLEKTLVMIATGTGIAPFRSMIKYIFSNSLKFNNIHLIFGTRYESDILFLDEWKELASNDSKFKFDVALSRQQIPGYHHGYVHDIYMEAYKGVLPENPYFMLCGWSGMIDQACVHLIKDMKVSTSAIKYELYG